MISYLLKLVGEEFVDKQKTIVGFPDVVRMNIYKLFSKHTKYINSANDKFHIMYVLRNDFRGRVCFITFIKNDSDITIEYEYYIASSNKTKTVKLQYVSDFIIPKNTNSFIDFINSKL